MSRTLLFLLFVPLSAMADAGQISYMQNDGKQLMAVQTDAYTVGTHVEVCVQNACAEGWVVKGFAKPSPRVAVISYDMAEALGIISDGVVDGEIKEAQN